jgi:hypothetical protein
LSELQVTVILSHLHRPPLDQDLQPI